MDLQSNTRVTPNVAEVAAKVIDGEAIIMNLSNGLYFSMLGSGADVWQLVEQGRSVSEMATVLADRYQGDAAVVQGDVEALVGQLLAENLVTEVDAASSEAEPAWGAVSGPYATPTLNKYNDMADLLALDPPMPGLANTTWEG